MARRLRGTAAVYAYASVLLGLSIPLTLLAQRFDAARPPFVGVGWLAAVHEAAPPWAVALAVVVLFAAAEQVRVRYANGVHGYVTLSLGAYVWTLALPLVAPTTAVLFGTLGFSLGALGLSRPGIKHLTNLGATSLALALGWALHRGLLVAFDVGSSWGVVFVAAVVACTLQVPVILTAIWLSAEDSGDLHPIAQLRGTAVLIVISVAFGIASAQLFALGGFATIIVSIVVGTLVSSSNLLDRQRLLLVDLQAERDLTDRQGREDTLTGLPNRSEFLAELTQILRGAVEVPRGGHPDRGVAVLLLDLDNFRDINDTLGHGAGDALLVEVANRLRTVARDGDMVCRLGGDEFGMLVRDVTDEGAVLGAASRILQALERPYERDGLLLETGASIGIALAPRHGDDSTTLLRRAEVAMYGAKDAGMGLMVFEEQDEEHAPRRLRLVGQLRRAIDEERLTVAYQPKLDLLTGRVVGVEALARWDEPGEGPISPAEFIPVAERTGLIHGLTRHVIDRALEDAADWVTAGVPLGIAINVSPRVLLDSSFTDFLAGRIAQHGLAPESVTLEVTESVVISESARIGETLKGLEQLGVRLSIDDYGTGYSSLSYLRRLNVDELKIDRSFVLGLVSNGNDAVLVESTIKLGHALGLKVVAEGVEDEAALDRLRDLACDVAQGYHIGRPMPALDILAATHMFDVTLD